MDLALPAHDMPSPQITTISILDEQSLKDICVLAALDDLLGYVVAGKPGGWGWHEWPKRCVYESYDEMYEETLPVEGSMETLEAM